MSAEKEKASVLLIVFRVIFTVATIATIIFIFSNSSEIGEVSSGRSESVLTFVNGFFERLGLDFRVSSYQMRKLGHVGEYALLGFFLMVTLRVYTKRFLSHITAPLFFGLLIAVIDETYRLYIPGRAGVVSDVLIDFGGVLLGIGSAALMLLVVRMFTVHFGRDGKAA